MELARQLQHRTAIAAAPRLIFAGEVILKALHVLARRDLDERVDDVGFDDAARGEYFACLAHRGLGHHGAAVAHQGHDPLVRQALQYLPQPGPTETEYLAELPFHQARLG